MKEDSFLEIKEFFRGLEINNGIIQVHFQLYTKWGVIEPTIEGMKMEKIANKPNNYIITADMEKVSLDDIYKFIKSIIEMNRDVDMKKALLKQKYEELIELFSNHTVDELTRLEFTFAKAKKKRVPKLNEDTTETNPKSSDSTEEITNKGIDDDLVLDRSKTDNNDKDTFIIKGDEIDMIDL